MCRCLRPAACWTMAASGPVASPFPMPARPYLALLRQKFSTSKTFVVPLTRHIPFTCLAFARHQAPGTVCFQYMSCVRTAMLLQAQALHPLSLQATRYCPTAYGWECVACSQAVCSAQARNEPETGAATGGPGGAGASGESAGGSGSGEGGMWLSLSQVVEWVLEFSCDMLFISIRTDVAWYRLTKCAPRLPIPPSYTGPCRLENAFRTCHLSLC